MSNDMDAALYQDLVWTGYGSSAPVFTDAQLDAMVSGKAVFEPVTNVTSAGVNVAVPAIQQTGQNVVQEVLMGGGVGAMVAGAEIAPATTSKTGLITTVVDKAKEVVSNMADSNGGFNWQALLAGVLGAGAGYLGARLTDQTPGLGGGTAGMDLTTLAQGGGGSMPAGQGVKAWNGIGGSQFVYFGNRRFACRKADGTIKTWRVPKNIVISGNPRLKDVRLMVKAMGKVEKMIRPFVKDIAPRPKYVPAGRKLTMVKV